MSLHPIIARALAAGASLAPYHALPIEEARATAQKAYRRLDEPVPVGRVQNLTWPSSESDIKVRVYTPQTPGPHAGIVFFHGSGFVMLNLDTHDDICRRLCTQSNRMVVSVDYRLAPEHPFPAAPNDCLAATLKVLELADSLGISNEGLALVGESAGACLAAVTAWRMQHSHEHSDSDSDSHSHEHEFAHIHVNAIKSLLLFYPVTDAPNPARPSYQMYGEGHGLSVTGMQWFWKQYMGSFSEASHPHATPLHANPLEGMPPTYIVTAGHDVLRDEGEDYFKRLLQAGTEATYQCCENLNHGFLKYAGQIDEVDQVIHQACQWLQQR